MRNEGHEARSHAKVSTISTRDEAVYLSDGLQEVESASRLRFTEDDRMHEVSLLTVIDDCSD